MDLKKELKDCKGLHIEVCGSWVWVSGDTKKHKDKLKSLGLFYAYKKKMWYLKPAGYKSRKHKPVDMEKIRMTYGSEVIA